MTNSAVLPPRDPQDFGWIVDNFALSTPGSPTRSSSRPTAALIAVGGMSADLADPLAAMTWQDHQPRQQHREQGRRSRLRPGDAQVPVWYFLFMSIGQLAGFADARARGREPRRGGARMAQLVDAVSHVLTPQLRDDLRRMKRRERRGGR
jgi:hypothetical protein